MKFLMSNRIFTVIIILTTVFTVISCKKDTSDKKNKVSDTEGTTYSLESLSIESGFDDIDQISQIAAEEDDLAATEGENKMYAPRFSHLRGIIGDSVKIVWSDSTYPKTLSIDFGDSTLGKDGRTRSGKIIMQLSAPVRQVGAISLLTLENFQVDHIKVEGIKTVTNISGAGVVKYSLKITGGKVTLPSGHGYTFETSKVRELSAGAETPKLQDNIWKLTGEGHVVLNTGTKIDFLITTPIIKKYACYYRTSGILKMTVNDNWEGSLDYAAPTNGECDNAAMLFWANGNQSKYITLD